MTKQRNPDKKRLAAIARKGGAATKAKYDRAHFAQLGSQGGAATREKHGSAHFAAIGKKGGDIVAQKGRAYYEAIGRLGAAKRASNRAQRSGQ